MVAGFMAAPCGIFFEHVPANRSAGPNQPILASDRLQGTSTIALYFRFEGSAVYRQAYRGLRAVGKWGQSADLFIAGSLWTGWVPGICFFKGRRRAIYQVFIARCIAIHSLEAFQTAFLLCALHKSLVTMVADHNQQAYRRHDRVFL
jgi:hypothetical protein